MRDVECRCWVKDGNDSWQQGVLRRAPLYKSPKDSYLKACRVMEQVTLSPGILAELQYSQDCPALLPASFSFVGNTHHTLYRYGCIVGLWQFVSMCCSPMLCEPCYGATGFCCCPYRSYHI